jgi:hypothetical protein
VAAITLTLLASAGARAETKKCDNLLELFAERREQNQAIERVPDEASKAELIPQRLITIEDLFTFDVAADTMGFRPEKKIIRATEEELEKILELTKHNTEMVVGTANEIAFYFEHLPLNSVSEAMNVVIMRDQLGVDPEVVSAAYLEAFDIAWHRQNKGEPAFPQNTDAGVVQPMVLGIAAIQIKNPEVASFDKVRQTMRLIEKTFANAKRMEQIQALQVFLANRIQDLNASFPSFVASLRYLQENLAIEERVMGFNPVAHTSPSLEDALMLKLLAAKAGYDDAEMVRAARSLIDSEDPETFLDLVGLIGSGLAELEQSEAPGLQGLSIQGLN